MIGLRKRLMHAYDQINFDTLWEIVQNDLRRCVAAREAILAETRRD